MPPSDSTPRDGSQRPLRVLVADDEPMIVRALTRLLERGGHSVASAPDAYGACTLLEAEAFDAVLVDQRMPGDGLTVLRKLDEMDFRGVAVLMTGALSADPLDVGIAVRRLQKPFPFASVIPILEGREP